jgi:hypothetical protein
MYSSMCRECSYGGKLEHMNIDYHPVRGARRGGGAINTHSRRNEERAAGKGGETCLKPAG